MRAEVVELAIPTGSDLLVLARLTAATLAARAQFGIDDVADLRLAVEELCLCVIGSAAEGTTRLRFSREDNLITISCSLTVDGAASLTVAPSGDRSDLSLRIIEALVDDHGHDETEGRPSMWIAKRGGVCSP
ncbi:MAG: ATP-binding protein [Acidimicrobiales bacterium]